MVKEKISYSLRQKILKLLIENKQKWTILEIAHALRVDYKNTFNAIEGLYPNLIFKEKKGNTNLIEIKLSSKIELFEVEIKRTLEFVGRNSDIKLIWEEIERVNYPFASVLLFGSFVKGVETKNSDIDICIISDNEEKVKKIVSNLKILPYKIEVQYFTSDEFESMLNRKENNVAKEIIENNIILYGIESYYQLISRWMKKE